MKKLFPLLYVLLMVLVACQKDDFISIPTIKDVVPDNQEQVILTKTQASSSNKYAIIINGGYNSTVNHPQYWNDCSIVYKMLKNEYGYSDNNIFVIMSDGTSSAADLSDGTSSPVDLDGDGISDIDYLANLGNLSTVFNAVANNTANGGDVFIYVTGPLYQSSTFKALGLWSGTYVTDAELSSYISSISTNAKTHILLNIPEVSSFGTYLVNRANSTITAVNNGSNGSDKIITVQDKSYSRFTYNWTAAMTGENPGTTSVVDADLDNDDNISFLEAFKYAKNYENSNDVFPDTDLDYLSYTHGLAGKLFDLPILTGSQHINISNTGVYSILNLPPSATVEWQYPSSLSNTSTNQSMRRLYATNTNLTIPNIEVSATISVAPLGITFPVQKIFNITYWKSGINMDTDGVLMTGFFTGDYGEVVLACDFPDVNTYTWTADNGFTADNPGNYAVTFTLQQGYDPQVGAVVNVIAEFLNPLGEMTYITRNFVLE